MNFVVDFFNKVVIHSWWMDGHCDHHARLFSHLWISEPTAALSPHSLHLAYKHHTIADEFWLQ